MNKKVMIYVISGVLAAIIIGLSIFLAIAENKNKDNAYYTKKVTLSRLQNDTPVKSVEITNTKLLNQLLKICNNINLEQDDTTKKLAIVSDIKVDLNNGTAIYLQKDLEDYCYIENENIKSVIKMPNGLLDFVNKNLPSE